MTKWTADAISAAHTQRHLDELPQRSPAPAQQPEDMISRAALVAQLEASYQRMKAHADGDPENAAICGLIAAGVHAAAETVKTFAVASVSPSDGPA